jgi:porphobilinogen synthase
MRDMLRETTISPKDLIWPIFVTESASLHTAVGSMPGVQRFNIPEAVQAARQAKDLGIPLLAIFPVLEPSQKTELGEEACNSRNLVCRAVMKIKEEVPEIGIMTDVALDPYTTHGHDGVLGNNVVDNDRTVEILARQAVVQAQAGADVVAPSDMMDGRVGAIRKALEAESLTETFILAYSAKFCSCLYGPFRDAVGSKSALGKKGKETYQLDVGNSQAAMRRVWQDIEEGADAVMVKPGTWYLDLVQRVSSECRVPTFAYHVSGEYAALRYSIDQGLCDERRALLEVVTCFKRAGATGVLTYFAPIVAQYLQE